MAMNAADNRRIPQWTLGDRLRKSREEAGISTDAMGALMGKSRNTILAWEGDTRNPSRAFDTLARWAEITDCDHDWLLTGRGSGGGVKIVSSDAQLIAA